MATIDDGVGLKFQNLLWAMCHSILGIDNIFCATRVASCSVVQVCLVCMYVSLLTRLVGIKGTKLGKRSNNKDLHYGPTKSVNKQNSNKKDKQQKLVIYNWIHSELK